MPEPFVTICLDGPPRGVDPFVVYKVTHIRTGKAYIGLTSQGVDARLRHHWKTSKHQNNVLYRAIRKYGRAAFSVEILATCIRSEDLPALEVKLIAEHKTYVAEGGYNMTRGGEGSPGICDEVRENMRTAARARMQNPETRAKISATLTGRRLPTDRVAKSSTSRIGKPLSESHKKKLSLAMAARSYTPNAEQRAKMSAGAKEQWRLRRLSSGGLNAK